MADIAIFRINYKSDFILTLNSDAGWMTPFCIKFWTGAPSQAYYAYYDGMSYTHCAPVDGEPTKLRVQFDDHHLPIGDLKFQIGYHFTVEDFPTTVEDEVLNQASVIIVQDGEPAQVMLDLNGETAPEIEFALPAYANEQQRIENEEQRIENEQARVEAEEARVAAENARVDEFAQLKTESEEATANANAAAQLATEKAALAQQKADYAQTQGDYAKAQGDYAKSQGDIAQADHQRAESDHATATADHTQAASDHSTATADHTQAVSDHTQAAADHTQAGADHTRAESDHTRAESDHEAVEVYVDSLGAFDISAYHATGGVLAKYADLTAALGTGGANIPEAIRKGGMSVKFVQSSDNKYVQYMYKVTDAATTATFIDVANWEKMNLEGEVSQLDQELVNLWNNIQKEEIPVTNTGYAIYLNGGIGTAISTPHASSGYMYSKFPVSTGDIIIVNGTGGGAPRLWGFVDSEELILSVANKNATGNNLVLIAPDNATEIIINTNMVAKSYYVAKDSVAYQLIMLNAYNDDLRIALNDANAGFVKLNTEMTPSGTYRDSETYNSSADIYVVDSLSYHTNLQTSTYIYCYDDSGFISRVTIGNALPPETKYIRINWIKTKERPYFFFENATSHQALLNNLMSRMLTAENELSGKTNTLSVLDSSLVTSKGVSCALYDLNNVSTIKDGYDLSPSSGRYREKNNWSASGDMYVNALKEYETNDTGLIYCYSDVSGFIGTVNVGENLLANTDYVRICWENNITKPVFSSKNASSFQTRIDKIDSDFENDYKVNDDDVLGKGIRTSGNLEDNPNRRVSSIIELTPNFFFICNVTGYYYFYDSSLRLIERVSIQAGTQFSYDTVEGAKYMRTSSKIDTPIVINELDAYGDKVVQKRIFKGVSQNEESLSYSFISFNELKLPQKSFTLIIDFTTNGSLYDRNSPFLMFKTANGISLELNFPTQENSYYCKKSSCYFNVRCGTNDVKAIRLRINNYGTDLFSMRLKYPVVNVAVSGKTTMVTPMPSNFENAYIKKANGVFYIYNGDDTLYRSYTLSNYTDVDAFVDSLKTDLSEHFEVIRYACEGVSFDQVDDFDKIYLSKEIQEVYYHNTDSNTGNVYYDSYPTVIRTTDIGYKHRLKIGGVVRENSIVSTYISLDGMFVRFSDKHLGMDMLMEYNTDFINVLSAKVEPYKELFAPMMSMQHNLVFSDELINETGYTSSKRQENMLAYLHSKGFVGQNINESISSILGSNAIISPTYSMHFDDRQKNIWTDMRLRNIFNKYKAKPTLIYLFSVEELEGVAPPDIAPTRDEYWDIKNSGWGIAAHGFSVQTGLLSYAQFVNGFEKTKTKWQEWYGEDIQIYNCHGQDLSDYQYYLLKNLGFSSYCGATASLGCFCECGTTIDVQYKRVDFLDSEINWETVKSYIDDWIGEVDSSEE